LTTTLLIWWWPLLLCSVFLIRVEVDSITAVLGRLLFIIHITILGVTLARFLWPRDQVNNNYRPVRIYASFFTVATMLFFIVCGIAGYLYSVKAVWDALVNALVIGVVLMFFYFLMQRWLLVVRRRLRFREFLAARAALDDDEQSLVEPEVNDLVTLSESVEKLLKGGTSLLFLLAVGYYWSPLFSGLEALQRVTLWTVSDVSGGEAILTSITLASAALALLIAFITYYAATSGSRLLELLLRGRKSVSPGSRYAVVKLLQYLIVGAGVIVVLSTLGVRWERLQWLVAALGVGIGFGLQEIIANFICGLIILFERPIRVGDVITVGESSGQVIRITIRATTIRDFDGKELLVPNKEFITGRLLNWTLSNTDIRMRLEVGIAYGSDVRKAQSILLDLLKNHEMILDDPEPDVLFREFGNSSLNLSARYFFSDVARRGYLLSDLHLKIYDAFAEAGIVIAFPQIDVHLASGKPDQADDIAPLPAG
jgi:potassium efflux system protein